MSKYEVLQQLGLSKTAIACYASLWEEGAANVTQLAERLSFGRTSLYRVLKHMEAQGFTTSVKSTRQPIYFYPEILEKALKNYANYQHRIVADLIEEQTARLTKMKPPRGKPSITDE